MPGAHCSSNSNRVNHEDGSFAEYIIVKPGPRAKTPDNLTDEEAATLGVAITTVVRIHVAVPFEQGSNRPYVGPRTL